MRVEVLCAEVQLLKQDFLYLLGPFYQGYTKFVKSFLDGVSFMERFGTIKVHLAELIEDRGISKNKLGQRAEMQRTQINHYCNNTITRLDIDVLARLCTVLDCEIGELLEFVPPDHGQGGTSEK